MIKELYNSALSLLNAYKKEPNTINAQAFDYMVSFIAKLEDKSYGDIVLKIKGM